MLRLTIALYAAVLALSPSGFGIAYGSQQSTPSPQVRQQPQGQGRGQGTNPQQPAGPILAEPPVKDVGVVKPEEVVTVVFKLVNPLDHDVTIVMAKTSCQCTGVDVLGKVIPAHGTLDMPASMRMSKAPIRKAATVTLVIDLGGGKKQPLQVAIYAEVAYAVRAAPGFIDALTPEGMTGTFELTATDGAPFRVLSANGEAPVAAGSGDPSAPSTRHALRYDFTKPGTVVPKYFVVETDRTDCPLIDLRVRHDTTHIRPPYKVAEFRSSFGAIPPQGVGSFELEIEEVGSHRISSAQSLDPNFEVSIVEQVSDGKNLNAKFSVQAGSGAKGVAMFPVAITLDGKRYEHLVMGVIRQ